MTNDTFCELLEDINKSECLFSGLMPKNLVTYPIPYFGDPESAKALTVGVNPSAGEFRNRGWPSEMENSAILHRLLHYFSLAEVKPHPWFRTWERCLRRLDTSYLTGEAAHIDISPRATRSMSQCDPDKFLEMCFRDVEWLFKLLDETSPKLLLMAGTVTKHHYMNDFMRLAANDHGWQLKGQSETKGKGRVGFHELAKGSTRFPVFFCSVSPSSPNGAELLVTRVEENSARIKDLI